MNDNLEEMTVDLINWLLRDLYWDVNDEQKFILRSYKEDFEEYFIKNKKEDLLKKMLENT